jgi:hypothetical protein
MTRAEAPQHFSVLGVTISARLCGRALYPPLPEDDNSPGEGGETELIPGRAGRPGSLARRVRTIEAAPGNHVTATREGMLIRPFDVFREMAARELGGGRTCAEAGIADIDLARMAIAGSGSATPDGP